MLPTTCMRCESTGYTLEPSCVIRLQGVDLRAMTGQDLLGKLFDTKRPQIFAESAVAGDGSDWSLTELGF